MLIFHVIKNGELLQYFFPIKYVRKGEQNIMFPKQSTRMPLMLPPADTHVHMKLLLAFHFGSNSNDCNYNEHHLTIILVVVILLLQTF